MSIGPVCLDFGGQFRPPLSRTMEWSRTAIRRWAMAEERTAQVALTVRELRWLLEQIGASVDSDSTRESIRDEIEAQLERALFELEGRE